MPEHSILTSDDTPPDLGIVRTIAAYIVAARGQCIDGPARESAQRRILDVLAAAGAGLHEPAVSAVRRSAAALLGGGSVPIWFAGEAASVVGAAWINSVAASTLDLDDGHRMARGHPGAAVIPTAFAVATETGADLEAILTAIVIGYEVGVTIGAARTSYGSTGTWSSYAVVAVAAALRHTSQEVLEHALAIAGVSAPNQLFVSAPAFSVPTPEGSDIKEGIPWSVLTGLFALHLAEGGFTGPRNLLDSPLHYRFGDLSLLGRSPLISSGYYKLACCCRHIHPPLDAFLGLMVEHGLDASGIDAVEVDIYSGGLRITNKTRPSSLIDVQYSIPYCLALAALYGREALLPLTTAALDQPSVSEFAEKIRLRLDVGLDSVFPAQTLARVHIMARGRCYTSKVTAPRGEAGDPLDWQALEKKFIDATRHVAGRQQQNQVTMAMQRLRADGDIESLMGSLAQRFEPLG